jgi:hypothetical protein
MEIDEIGNFMQISSLQWYVGYLYVLVINKLAKDPNFIGIEDFQSGQIDLILTQCQSHLDQEAGQQKLTRPLQFINHICLNFILQMYIFQATMLCKQAWRNLVDAEFKAGQLSLKFWKTEPLSNTHRFTTTISPKKFESIEDFAKILDGSVSGLCIITTDELDRTNFEYSGNLDMGKITSKGNNEFLYDIEPLLLSIMHHICLERIEKWEKELSGTLFKVLSFSRKFMPTLVLKISEGELTIVMNPTAGTVQCQLRDVCFPKSEFNSEKLIENAMEQLESNLNGNSVSFLHSISRFCLAVRLFIDIDFLTSY